MNTKHFSIRLNDDTRTTIAELAEKWGISQTQVVERAISILDYSITRTTYDIMADLQMEFLRISALMNELEEALRLRDAQALPIMPPPRKRGRRPALNKNIDERETLPPAQS